ncbi:VacJ family lipoprotein [Lysobacter sp. H23M47]|uniref:MlaA family lipoprotein n=1 Tax=Lysobacter sp. H23M47 TaxID=2781024 RepID=UPI001881D8D5|nr:VacJ family lipoprotein [Lysobacter sp. H23M47]QOW24567.1 VacJ family lipoprotein [Lysobacter sp. H23M47]
MPTRPRNRHRRAPSQALGLCLVLAVASVGCASAQARSDAAPPASSADSLLNDPLDPGADSAAAVAGDSPAQQDAGEQAETTTGIAAPDEDTADAQVRTAAERDFDALYGPYDPVADPNLPAAAQMPGVYDPWERYNRSMHRFNNAVDRSVARPLARFYVAVTPRPVRLGVSNFFSNLGQPVTAVNALLQGKPGQAGQAMGRFVLNTTLGIAGIFDPASDANLDRRSEDFGQTLGVWGWERSRYVELPLFGPRTVRDVLGMVGDAPLSPLRQVEEDKIRIPLQGLQLVDVRTQLLSTDSLREGAADDYALVRDAWMQRRNYQILGDRMNEETDDALPDYLRDDDNPLVPASAMPVMPTDN